MDWKRIKWLVVLAGASVGVVVLFLLMRPPALDHVGHAADAPPEQSANQNGADAPMADQSDTATAEMSERPPRPTGQSDVASLVSQIEQPEPSSLWTDEDGRSINAIRLLAHNEQEVQRMLAENDKIYRRQLVTLTEPVVSAVQQNHLTGEPLDRLTLQGLDGQEIQFDIQHADIDPSGLRGSFYGQVEGRAGSMVTLAFLNQRQAYTVFSSEDNLFLDVESHDPGVVVVKSINVQKYYDGKCGSPDLQ